MSKDAEDKPGEKGDAAVIVSITEYRDGSATFSFDMPPEVMRSFAAVGLRAALEKAVAKVETMV